MNYANCSLLKISHFPFVVHYASPSYPVLAILVFLLSLYSYNCCPEISIPLKVIYLNIHVYWYGTFKNQAYAGLHIVTTVWIFSEHPARKAPRATPSINGQAPDASPVPRLLPPRRGKRRWSSRANRGLARPKQKLKVEICQWNYPFGFVLYLLLQSSLRSTWYLFVLNESKA